MKGCDVIRDAILKIRRDIAPHAEETQRDCTVCPFCGFTNTSLIDLWINDEDSTESESRECFDCNQDYTIHWGESDLIRDVCDRHNRSLLYKN